MRDFSRTSYSSIHCNQNVTDIQNIVFFYTGILHVYPITYQIIHFRIIILNVTICNNQKLSIFRKFGTIKRETSTNARNFPKLTLFPSVSKTGEANFGYQLAIFRKHFFQHRFLDVHELVILTLMKGDEVIQSVKEIRNSLLLAYFWVLDIHVRNHLKSD